MSTGTRPNVRVVLDTNVVLSGIFFGGLPGRILDAWQAGHLTLVLSPVILAEYHRAGAALAVRYPSAETALGPLLALLAQAATIVNAPELAAAVSADPEDDKFLACALASRTPVIVSGDKHLLRVSGWRGIEVLTSRQMIDRYRIKQ
ncbi:MAG: putative toxin-antitoxin system toxin component, PIN family [Gemmatimonadaceae bacterium]|nr:putative toxin-antitoxin system toxin component, PIN family [Gemmatimonadaceae bacterium]